MSSPGMVEAANVRAELARRGETQAVLADLLDLTDSSISRRLRGETLFRSWELGTIAKFFGVTTDSLQRAPLKLVEDTG